MELNEWFWCNWCAFSWGFALVTMPVCVVAYWRHVSILFVDQQKINGSSDAHLPLPKKGGPHQDSNLGRPMQIGETYH